MTMLGKNGSHLVWDDVFFETSKIIGKYLHPTKETLSFSFSGELDLSGIPRFLITIRPVSEILTGTNKAQTPPANSSIRSTCAQPIAACKFEILNL